MMRKNGAAGSIALLVSAAMHALLLLIPWQPAQVVDLLPLEGAGIVELAAISPAKGSPGIEVVEEEPVEQQQKAVAKVVPDEKSVTTVAPKAATKPQVVQAPAKPKAEIVVSDKGTTPVPAETVEEQGEPGIETEADGGTEPVEQAAPVGPSYPGEDPTGEAMVTSKRAMTYPKESMSSYSEGDVMVEVYVAASGTVMATNVLSGPDDIRLREMAVKTIARYWSFKPAERNYKVVIEVSFKMEPVAAAEPHFISATFID